MKKFVRMGIILLCCVCLMACTSKKLAMKEDVFKVELGKQVSTKASVYLRQDIDEEVLDNTHITFEKSDSYTVDSKGKVLKPIEGEFLPVGKYEATASYEDEMKAITVEVKDTTAPKFVDFKKEIIIEANAEGVDLAKYFKVEDLSESKIVINKGKTDLSKAGTYEINITAIDDYKNASTKKATIKVVTMDVAEKEDVTATVDGTKPVSKALKEKKAAAEEEAKKQEAANQQAENNTQQPQSGTTSGGGNTGGNINTAPQRPSTPTACVPDGTYGRLGNSGRWFTSLPDAEAWAQSQWFDETSPYYLMGYDAITVIDSCGNEVPNIWTIGFY